MGHVRGQAQNSPIFNGFMGHVPEVRPCRRRTLHLGQVHSAAFCLGVQAIPQDQELLMPTEVRFEALPSLQSLGRTGAPLAVLSLSQIGTLLPAQSTVCAGSSPSLLGLSWSGSLSSPSATDFGHGSSVLMRGAAWLDSFLLLTALVGSLSSPRKLAHLDLPPVLAGVSQPDLLVPLPDLVQTGPPFLSQGSSQFASSLLVCGAALDSLLSIRSFVQLDVALFVESAQLALAKTLLACSVFCPDPFLLLQSFAWPGFPSLARCCAALGASPSPRTSCQPGLPLAASFVRSGCFSLTGCETQINAFLSVRSMYCLEASFASRSPDLGSRFVVLDVACSESSLLIHGLVCMEPSMPASAPLGASLAARRPWHVGLPLSVSGSTRLDSCPSAPGHLGLFLVLKQAAQLGFAMPALDSSVLSFFLSTRSLADSDAFLLTFQVSRPDPTMAAASSNNVEPPLPIQSSSHLGVTLLLDIAVLGLAVPLRAPTRLGAALLTSTGSRTDLPFLVSEKLVAGSLPPLQSASQMGLSPFLFQHAGLELLPLLRSLLHHSSPISASGSCVRTGLACSTGVLSMGSLLSPRTFACLDSSMPVVDLQVGLLVPLHSMLRLGLELSVLHLAPTDSPLFACSFTSPGSVLLPHSPAHLGLTLATSFSQIGPFLPIKGSSHTGVPTLTAEAQPGKSSVPIHAATLLGLSLSAHSSACLGPPISAPDPATPGPSATPHAASHVGLVPYQKPTSGRFLFVLALLHAELPPSPHSSSRPALAISAADDMALGIPLTVQTASKLGISSLLLGLACLDLAFLTTGSCQVDFPLSLQGIVQSNAATSMISLRQCGATMSPQRFARLELPLAVPDKSRLSTPVPVLDCPCPEFLLALQGAGHVDTLPPSLNLVQVDFLLPLRSFGRPDALTSAVGMTCSGLAAAMGSYAAGVSLFLRGFAWPESKISLAHCALGASLSTRGAACSGAVLTLVGAVPESLVPALGVFMVGLFLSARGTWLDSFLLALGMSATGALMLLHACRFGVSMLALGLVRVPLLPVLAVADLDPPLLPQSSS